MSLVAHHMKVSRNGQVSIPAAVRARWKTERVVVVDMGDHIVLAPAVEDPVGTYRGWLKTPGAPNTDELRRRDRLDDEAHEARTLGRA